MYQQFPYKAVHDLIFWKNKLEEMCIFEKNDFSKLDIQAEAAEAADCVRSLIEKTQSCKEVEALEQMENLFETISLEAQNWRSKPPTDRITEWISDLDRLINRIC